MAQTLTDIFNIRVQFPIDLRTVKDDLNARNAIEPLQRYDGLTVWVVSEQKLYRLIGGITNDDWVDQTPNGGIQAVTVSSASPTGGNPGDIHFKNVPGGTEVWYNEYGSWGIKGVLSGGSSPTYTQDQNVPNTGAASYLNATYPDAKVGDQVYSIGTTQRRTWTCYAPGAWSRIDETLES